MNLDADKVVFYNRSDQMKGAFDIHEMKKPFLRNVHSNWSQMH